MTTGKRSSAQKESERHSQPRVSQLPRNLLIWQLALSVVSGFTFSAEALADKQTGHPKATQRIIQFPKESVGSLTVVTPNGDNSFNVGPAAGRVTVDVPPNGLIQLQAGVRVYREPKLLAMIEPPIIDCFTLQFIAADEQETNTCNKVMSYVARFKGLVVLNLNRSDVSDAGVSEVRNMPKLKRIMALGGNLHGSCFKDLQTVPNLETLEVAWCPLDEKNLVWLANCPKLNSLNLARTKMTEAGARQILKIPHLRKLNVSENPSINGSFLKDFQKLQELTELRLKQCPLDKSSLLFLPRLPKLTTLELCKTNLDDNDIATIAKCSTLERLYLRENSKLTDKSLSYLANLKRLTVLDLRDTAVTAAGIKQLLSKLPTLSQIGVPKPVLLKEGFAPLKMDRQFLNLIDQESQPRPGEDDETLFRPLH